MENLNRTDAVLLKIASLMISKHLESLARVLHWSMATLDYARAELPDFCPHRPFGTQQEFLDNGAVEVMYGGGAGGGKTDALLMAALQYVHVPFYRAIIFRQTYTDLILPGSIVDRSHDWLDEAPDTHWIAGELKWVFPSGASLQFGYLELPQDHLKWTGSCFQFIGFDELTAIREKHYRYLFSRLRHHDRPEVPLRIRSTATPADNWVRHRFFEAEGEQEFIRAGIQDNPYVDQAAWLQALDALQVGEKRRLLAGEWYGD